MDIQVAGKLQAARGDNPVGDVEEDVAGTDDEAIAFHTYIRSRVRNFLVLHVHAYLGHLHAVVQVHIIKAKGLVDRRRTSVRRNFHRAFPNIALLDRRPRKNGLHLHEQLHQVELLGARLEGHVLDGGVADGTVAGHLELKMLRGEVLLDIAELLDRALVALVVHRVNLHLEPGGAVIEGDRLGQGGASLQVGFHGFRGHGHGILRSEHVQVRFQRESLGRDVLRVKRQGDVVAVARTQ